jgi:hypothetical protein
MKQVQDHFTGSAKRLIVLGTNSTLLMSPEEAQHHQNSRRQQSGLEVRLKLLLWLCLNKLVTNNGRANHLKPPWAADIASKHVTP